MRSADFQSAQIRKSQTQRRRSKADNRSRRCWFRRWRTRSWWRKARPSACSPARVRSESRRVASKKTKTWSITHSLLPYCAECNQFSDNEFVVGTAWPARAWGRESRPVRWYAVAARQNPVRLRRKTLQGGGRHRCRLARHPRGQRGACHQLRPAGGGGRFHPPRRPHRARRFEGRASSLVSGAEIAELRAIERALKLKIARRRVDEFAGSTAAHRPVQNTRASRTLSRMPGEVFS